MAFCKKRVFRYSCIFLFVFAFKVDCYEKTLRKMVRSESKMVQRPLGVSSNEIRTKSSPPFYQYTYSGPKQKIDMYHKLQKPKISTYITTMDSNWSKPINKINLDNYAEVQTVKNIISSSSPVLMTASPLFLDYSEYLNTSSRSQSPSVGSYYEIRSSHSKQDLSSNEVSKDINRKSLVNARNIQSFYKVPIRTKYVSEDSNNMNILDENLNSKDDTVVIPYDDESLVNITLLREDENLQSKPSLSFEQEGKSTLTDTLDKEMYYPEKPEEFLESKITDLLEQNGCDNIPQLKTHLETQEKFIEFDIEPTWMKKKHFWNEMFENRYLSLIRDPKWPPLKVILIPCTHVDTIWKRSFEQYHNNSVSDILSNVVKKLHFYKNLTFNWNEVSHLSHWWKNAKPQSRSAFRQILKEGRLEITTGGWVETDEATAHIFGLVHQLIEGHQWLKYNLNYLPEVAWLTSSVAHSPTMAYLLTVLDITKLVMTNLHYSWEEYFAEYQLSDFVWVQNWDKTAPPSSLNNALQKLGNERYPKHAVLTHHLQFNSASVKACGPNKTVCSKVFDFAKLNRDTDVNQYNIKNKSELLLEQYSKTGTLTPHNIIMAPLGGSFRYESKTEFDFQFNNYNKMADYVNENSKIYKATIKFGTPIDYFNEIMEKHTTYPTLKGDFLNFADISSGAPAYWTGFYTSRPSLKILLRRLLSTLRTTEIILTFTVNIRKFDSFCVIERLIKIRQTVARLMDRNVISGTLNNNALKYVHQQILNTAKDCWYIQELSVSHLIAKSTLKTPNLQKYIYRDGEFITAFRSVYPGDQIYVFNSLTQERTELVEFVTKYYNIRIVNHNKKDIPIQINPVWRYNSKNVIILSRKYFKVSFFAIVPPMTLTLFKIKETYDVSQSISSIYCSVCVIDEAKNDEAKFPFDIQPIKEGDIQIESYKYRLLFDEFTGFLKTVTEKETNLEKVVMFDFGAFKSSHINSGMFLFNTDLMKPIENILKSHKLKGSNTKIVLIVSGQLTTQLTTIYGRLLKHALKIFNLQKTPLSRAIYVENKIDYEASPKNRELELFMSIQTEIGNGYPPQLFIDNNGFQYSAKYLNISRRIESNMYPITTMAYIQDTNNRLSILTDHAQGVTAFHEGQIIVMLDRRVLFNDGRGTNEGLADNSATYHRYFVLLENFIQFDKKSDKDRKEIYISLPSLPALHLADCLNYLLDQFIINKSESDLCSHPYLPLIKNPFPCNVHVINYRINNYEKNINQNINYTGLLILHRVSYSCHIDHYISLSCQSDSKFSLKDIIRRSKSVYQTNLSGTNIGTLINIVNEVNFPPMALSSFRIIC